MDIHGDIEHLASDNPYQLALRLADLIVKPPQYVLRRTGMVALNEAGLHAGELSEAPRVDALEKIPAHRRTPSA